MIGQRMIDSERVAAERSGGTARTLCQRPVLRGKPQDSRRAALNYERSTAGTCGRAANLFIDTSFLRLNQERGGTSLGYQDEQKVEVIRITRAHQLYLSIGPRWLL